MGDSQDIFHTKIVSATQTHWSNPSISAKSNHAIVHSSHFYPTIVLCRDWSSGLLPPNAGSIAELAQIGGQRRHHPGRITLQGKQIARGIERVVHAKPHPPLHQAPAIRRVAQFRIGQRGE